MIDWAAAEKMSDAELVALSLENQADFAFIIQRYKLRLFTYIRRLSNISPEDAEDLLQEIFLKIYLNLNDFDSGLKFSSWAYAIAHNQIISNYRKLRVRPEGHQVGIDSEAARRLASGFDIAAGVDSAYLAEKVQKILDELPAKYREVLVLKFLEEKNYQEISDIIKKPVGTVGSMLNQAKKEFKASIEKNNIKI